MFEESLIPLLPPMLLPLPQGVDRVSRYKLEKPTFNVTICLSSQPIKELNMNLGSLFAGRPPDLEQLI